MEVFMEKCSNCNKTIDTETAAKDGWVPYYWNFNKNIECGTLCVECTKLLGVKYDEKTTENYLGELPE